MATPITIASFQDACSACADAIASGDLKTANLQYGRAEAILAGLNINQEMSSNGAMVRQTQSLEALGRTLDRLRANSVQDPNEDIAVTNADFRSMRE